MADLRFWLDMDHRAALKRNDKLLIGNVDDEKPNYIDVSELLTPLTSDDLTEGSTNKYLSSTLKTKLENLPSDPLTSTAADAAYYPLSTNPNGYLTANSTLSSAKLSGTIAAALIPNLDAEKIVSGVMNAARIPSLPASKTTSGVFDIARIPDLPTSKITGLSGQLGNYIPTSQKGAANGVTPLDANSLIAAGYIPNLSADKIATGVLSADRIPEFFLQENDLGQPNRVASLDDSGHLEIDQLDLDYLDIRYAGGYKRREACRVVTASNITLSGLQTIDGVSLIAGDRILVKNQTNAALNGIYIAATGAWSRSADFDEVNPEEIVQGANIFIEQGALLGKTGWSLATGGIIELDVTPLVFDQYTAANNYIGGNKISLDGNQINHDTGTWTAKSNLSGAAVISNISVDAYGHISNWTTRNLTAANIGALTQATADGRYINKSVEDTKTYGDLKFSDNVSAYFGDKLKINSGSTVSNIQLYGGDLLIRDDSDTKITIGRTTGDITTTGKGDFQMGSIHRGSGDNVRVFGSGNGASNLAYISFSNSTGSIRHGYLGFASDKSYDMVFRNEISGDYLRLLESSGVNSLVYNVGSSTYTVYNSGNFGKSQIDALGINASQLGGNSSSYYRNANNINSGTLAFERIPVGTTSSTVKRGDYQPSYSDITGTNPSYIKSESDGRFLRNSTNQTYSGRMTMIRDGEQLRLQSQTGDLAFLSFFNSSLNQNGYLGFGSSSRRDLQIYNATANTFINIDEDGTVDGLKFTVSGTEHTVHNSGNFGKTQIDALGINADRIDGKHVWTGSQASYNAIGTKDANTLYFIT